MGGDGTLRGANTLRGREAARLLVTRQLAGANKRRRQIKTKAAPAAQRQQLKQQRCNVSGGFGGQRVVAVALMAALTMALVEQWQWWVRQQSNKKMTIN
jgi:hypothetical protein